MESDPLYKYAKQLVDEKGNLPDEIKKSMLADILLGMNDSLDAEIVSRLTLTGIDEFNKLLDKNPTPDEVIKFLEDSGVNIQNATSVALNRFIKAYDGVQNV